MTGIAALAICAAFTSCSHEIEQLSEEELDQFEVQKIKANYEQAFIKTFGQPASNQDWGFGVSNASTRSITVNGDVYDKFPSKDEVDANFPTTIPEDADEVADLETKYKGTKVQVSWGETTMGDLWAIYAYKIVEGYNLKITQAGVTTVGGGYYNIVNGKPKAYNIYVDVPGGKVTLKRNEGHFNLYVLSGEVTLESNYGEQAGLISVGENATVNDQRNSIAANQGIKVFNRGTFNATNTEKYDIGNFCTFYNEGKFTATGALTYSPGDANTSYFMNLGDKAELTAPAMTLNSAGNFFNSGKVDIDGETKVTQKDIYWVNDGHYTTGTLEFSAWNSTFYNYCQLIVKGEAYMHDGEFNLMENSYTEAGSAKMNNFAVNMGSNTGMYIKGNLRLLGQGDNSFQGFRTEGTNDYLLIDGKAIVDCHKNTFSITKGITYSINGIDIVKGTEVVSLTQLEADQSGDLPVYVIDEATECPYGELSVTPNTNSCGATWKKKDNPADLRIIAEDLSVGDGNEDFDFNDVVIDVYYGEKGYAKAKILAAGGTLDLKVDGKEVHNEFSKANNNIDCAGKMINTKGTQSADAYVRSRSLDDLTEPVITLTKEVKTPAQARDNIKIEVYKNNQWIELEAVISKVASKVRVGTDYQWKNEREYVGDDFKDFVSGAAGYSDWYKQPQQ